MATLRNKNLFFYSAELGSFSRWSCNSLARLRKLKTNGLPRILSSPHLLGVQALLIFVLFMATFKRQVKGLPATPIQFNQKISAVVPRCQWNPFPLQHLIVWHDSDPSGDQEE